MQFHGKISDKGCMSLKYLLGIVAYPDCSKPFKIDTTNPQQNKLHDGKQFLLRSCFISLQMAFLSSFLEFHGTFQLKKLLNTVDKLMKELYAKAESPFSKHL